MQLLLRQCPAWGRSQPLGGRHPREAVKARVKFGAKATEGTRRSPPCRGGGSKLPLTLCCPPRESVTRRPWRPWGPQTPAEAAARRKPSSRCQGGGRGAGAAVPAGAPAQPQPTQRPARRHLSGDTGMEVPRATQPRKDPPWAQRWLSPLLPTADACPALSRGLDFMVGPLGDGWSPCGAKASPTPAVTHGESSAPRSGQRRSHVLRGSQGHRGACASLQHPGVPLWRGVPGGVPGLGMLSPAPRMGSALQSWDNQGCARERGIGVDMGDWEPRCPRLRSCTPWHRGQRAHFALGRKQPRSRPGLPQTPASVGCRQQRSCSGMGPRPARLCLCSRQHFGGSARAERCLGCPRRGGGGSRRRGICSHLPTLAKRRGWGGPSVGVPGHSPLPSPPLVSRPPLQAQRRPPDPAAQDARMRPPAQSPQLSNPSASFSPSQPVSPQLCPAPSVRPPVRLSVSLRRARPQRLAGGRGGCAPPRQEFSFLSLVFPSSFSPRLRPL